MEQTASTEPRRRISRLLWLDAACLAAVILFAWMIVTAALINIQECPINGVWHGSSYRPTAPCNETWVAKHPYLAEQIRGLPKHDSAPALWGSVLLIMTGGYSVPSLLLTYLVIRICTRRLQRVYRLWLSLIGSCLLVEIFYLAECVSVIMD